MLNFSCAAVLEDGIKLQDTGLVIIPLSLAQNVGDQPLGNVIEPEVQVLALDQLVKEQAYQNDAVSSGKEEENVAATHAEKEPLLNERHALDSTGKANVEATTGRTSSAASLLISPSPSVKLTPPLNNSGPSVSNTSSIFTASPFEGFHSQPKDVTTFTSPVTPQFSKPALEQVGGDGKGSLVAKPLFKGSSSSPSPNPSPSSSASPLSKLEKSVQSGSSPRAEDKPQPAVSLPQPLPTPTALPPDVNVSEALDSQLSNLVSGLPVPSQRSRKGLQASLLVVEGNGLVSQPARKPKAQTMDLPQSGRVVKEPNKCSMRDQGHVKNALPKVLENGTSRLESDETLSGRSKESNLEDDRDASPSNLLVEDVHSQNLFIVVTLSLFWLSHPICEFIVGRIEVKINTLINEQCRVQFELNVLLANRSKFVIPAVTLVTRNCWLFAVDAAKVPNTREYFYHLIVFCLNRR